MENYLPILVPYTAIVFVISLFLGTTNAFICDNPNNCTSAAMEDISDFDISDILDIGQFLFILAGDLIEAFSFPFLADVPIMRTIMILTITLPWLVYIVTRFI